MGSGIAPAAAAALVPLRPQMVLILVQALSKQVWCLASWGCADSAKHGFGCPGQGTRMIDEYRCAF